jgi:type I restriction enzyme R subunit
MTTPEMEKDQFREVAVELFNKVKKNASIDWAIKESVKAKLKVIVTSWGSL